MAIGSRYGDTFNTETTHRISCQCIYYIWLLATNSRLLQMCTVHLPLYADGAKKKKKLVLWTITLTRLC
jgi:hypothetical protein